jgi:hypothetical protein
MAMKRPSLTDTMKAVEGARPVRIIPADVAEQSLAAGEGRATPTFREGKKRVMTPLSVEDHRRLKRLSADTGETMEELMVEAVMDFLTKRGA